MLAVRTPRGRKAAAPTVTDLCDRFLVFKDELLQAGELTERTFAGYKVVTDLLVAKFGHRAAGERARDMCDRCHARGIAFFSKQSAGYRTEMGIQLDGKIMREYPRLRVADQSRELL